MIKYICDIENCGKEALNPVSVKETIGLQIPNFPLFYIHYEMMRHIENAVFCKEHYKIALEEFIRLLKLSL